MSVLVNKKLKILVQGITGAQASFHVQRALKYGTNIVAGVAPNKKETSYLGLPLFGTVQEAKEKTGANASIVFVPAKYAKSAIIEAMGIFPDNIHKSGNIGIVSRSSTLTYEVVLEINKIGFGESTVVGLGDDFIIGTSFVEIIKKFNSDKNTKAIVLIGGIGGNYETEAADFYAKLTKKKTTIALILDDPTPLSDNKGLAPEIICRGITSSIDKKRILQNAGMIVVDNINALKDELLKL